MVLFRQVMKLGCVTAGVGDGTLKGGRFELKIRAVSKEKTKKWEVH
jgi:hypothetical protein